jgi:hypothetical protein
VEDTKIMKQRGTFKDKSLQYYCTVKTQRKIKGYALNSVLSDGYAANTVHKNNKITKRS